MVWNIHIANVEDQLLGHENQIEASIRRALSRTDKVLTLKSLDILVMVSPYGVIPHLGLGGYCSTDKLIQLAFQPDNKNFPSSLGETLERIVAHELHHSQRYRHCGFGKTLGEAIVLEGLACQFVKQLFNNEPESWENALDAETLGEVAVLAQHKWDDTDYNYREWFFGSEEFPKWAGYSVGYSLIGKFLELFPQETPATLVDAPAEKFKFALQHLVA